MQPYTKEIFHLLHWKTVLHDWEDLARTWAPPKLCLCRPSCFCQILANLATHALQGLPVPGSISYFDKITRRRPRQYISLAALMSVLASYAQLQNDWHITSAAAFLYWEFHRDREASEQVKTNLRVLNFFLNKVTSIMTKIMFANPLMRVKLD